MQFVTAASFADLAELVDTLEVAPVERLAAAMRHMRARGLVRTS